MSEQARVSSVPAVEEFRARLILFIAKARAGVEEASDEVRRTRAWLESEQRTHWENECRRRRRALDEAEQLLFSAKLSQFRSQTATQILAVERAKQAVRTAEEKRDSVRRWIREFENRAEPLVNEVEQLLTFVGTDLGKGAAYLGTVVKLLEAYTLVPVPGGDAAPLAAREPAPDQEESSRAFPHAESP